NGTLFFTADDVVFGRELWKSDGTAAGTVPVSGLGGSNLTNVNGTLFFTADGGNGTELWKSDGTTAGTTLVKDIYPGGAWSYVYQYPQGYWQYTPYSSWPANLTNVNGTLLFTASDGNGRELWRSDGTAAGTVLVKDINPGSSSYPSDLTNVNGT